MNETNEMEWEHHAQKLTKWLLCMSYNDSYFGEPKGLVKQVTSELDRLIGVRNQVAQSKLDLANKLADELIDAAEEWARYVEVDTAPISLVKHLEAARNAAIAEYDKRKEVGL